jgi:hypothetical protein
MTTGAQFSEDQSSDRNGQVTNCACRLNSLQHVNQPSMKSVKTFHFFMQICRN